jgi:peptide/nickel transport system ATP-binding protein/peptide/nickel transport system permease protein
MSEVEATAMDSDLPMVAAIDAFRKPPAGMTLRRRIRRLLRNRGAMLAIAFLALLTICALFGGLLEPFNPNAIDIGNRNATPSWTHWLGTDDLGRDLLSRLIAGAAISLRISVQAVVVALLVALPIGLFSAYVGGSVDAVIMRFVDAGLSFPPLVLALALAGVLGPSAGNAAIAISAITLPGFIRLVRGSALSVKHETFVEASRSVGVPTHRILARRILPNIRSPIIVAASLAFGGTILAEAGLSFLGLSVQPPDASWGNMLRSAYDFSLFTYPWQLVIPGIAIALTVLAYNTLGDALRDVLSAADTAGPRRSGRQRGRGGRARRGRRGITSVEPRAAVATNGDAQTDGTLLAIEGLSVEFESDRDAVRVVEDVSFAVRPREILGLVGESGSGKTVTSLAIMRLLDSPPARIVSGSVRLEGRDLLALSLDEMRRIRGASMAMVFQDPMASLNPAYTVRDQITEAYRLHHDVDRAAATRRALEMLDLVEIPGPEQRLHDYPHQLSGGMRQRVMLAIALVCRPKLLIADEPTTALDVTVQAQILDLLRVLQHELDLSVIFVTHDLGVVADLCDRVAVMYAGQIVEQAPVHDLFRRPRHPYTAGLLQAMPQAGSPQHELAVIPGVVPAPDAMPTGCRFAPRCPFAEAACSNAPVAIQATSAVGPSGDAATRLARCVRASELTLEGTS